MKDMLKQILFLKPVRELDTALRFFFWICISFVAGSIILIPYFLILFVPILAYIAFLTEKDRPILLAFIVGFEMVLSFYIYQKIPDLTFALFCVVGFYCIIFTWCIVIIPFSKKNVFSFKSWTWKRTIVLFVISAVLIGFCILMFRIDWHDSALLSALFIAVSLGAATFLITSFIMLFYSAYMSIIRLLKRGFNHKENRDLI